MTKQSSPKSFSYLALPFRQRDERSPQLVLFHAPVSEVAQWAEVKELGPRRSGHQREKRGAKVQAIRNFFSADNRNTIPTALIVTFASGHASYTGKARKSGKPEAGELSIKSNAKAHVVDGQHRLHGILEFDPSMHVPVVGLLDVDAVEEAFQFLVINNKATRVAPKHTKAVLADMQRTDLAERLRAARLSFDEDGIKDVDLVNSDKESPFYQTVDWSTTPKARRMVPATGIEFSLDYLANLGIADLADRDVRRSVFLAMWRVIKKSWSSLWVTESRLVSKVGVTCLTRVIIDFIVNWSDNDALEIDISNLDDIEKNTRTIIGFMNPAFWQVPWSERAQGGFDTTQGRERVRQALVQLYRNGRSGIRWNIDIDIIDAVAGDGEAPETGPEPSRARRRKKSANVRAPKIPGRSRPR
jgi:DGQHR domain-containing protein